MRTRQPPTRLGLIGFNEIVRALVISDTHFGAWTGEDILSEPENLALLAPHLDVDEVIILGDLFDLLFASSRDAFTASAGLFELLRERLQGRRFVFLAGNHDHSVVARRQEELVELELAAGGAGDRRDRSSALTRFAASSSAGLKASRSTFVTPPTHSAGCSARMATISTSTPRAIAPFREGSWRG